MAFFDYLIWGGVTLIIGGPIGIVCAKFAVSNLKKQDTNKVFEVIDGRKPNTLKLDGEEIQVSKFQYKKSDGELIKVNLADIIPKTSQKALNEGKTSLLGKLKNMFTRKKKVAEKPLKVPVPEEFSFKDKKGKKITLHAKKTKGKK